MSNASNEEIRKDIQPEREAQALMLARNILAIIPEGHTIEGFLGLFKTTNWESHDDNPETWQMVNNNLVSVEALGAVATLKLRLEVDAVNALQATPVVNVMITQEGVFGHE